jgi:ATP-dependent RNA helicase RhlE
MSERRADLRHTEVLVLDEVDQMLDLGFIHPIRQVVAVLPKQRQNLFFSATMPREIRKLADELLRDPVSVSVAPVATTVERVEQRVIFVEAARKRDLLAELFADPAMARAIVFTRTKRGADKVAKHLQVCGVPAEAIHGNKSQGQRERSLAAFRNGRARALVATDIAARGIDIDGVTHVVNYELPNVPEAYVHRIGRTARAGAAGAAIALCDREEMSLLRDIEKLTRLRLPATDRRDPSARPTQVEPQDSERREQHGRPQGRPQRHGRPHGGRPNGQSQGNGHPNGDRPNAHAPRSGKPNKHKSRHRFGRPGQRGEQRVAAE